MAGGRERKSHTFRTGITLHSRLNGMQLFAVGFAPMHFAWTQIVPQSIVIGSIFFTSTRDNTWYWCIPSPV